MIEGTVIQWPESQNCVSCREAVFIDITIDGIGSVYVCPLNRCTCTGEEHTLTQLHLKTE
jgi:hypothetical protein